MSKERVLEKAYRDPESQAVVVNDPDAYEAARGRKHLVEKIKMRGDELDGLKQNIRNLEKKLDLLISAIQ